MIRNSILLIAATIILFSCSSIKELHQRHLDKVKVIGKPYGSVIKIVPFQDMHISSNDMYSYLICALDGEEFLLCKTSLELDPGKHELLLVLKKLHTKVSETKITRHFAAGERYYIRLNESENTLDISK